MNEIGKRSSSEKGIELATAGECQFSRHYSGLSKLSGIRDLDVAKEIVSNIKGFSAIFISEIRDHGPLSRYDIESRDLRLGGRITVDFAWKGVRMPHFIDIDLDYHKANSRQREYLIGPLDKLNNLFSR